MKRLMKMVSVQVLVLVIWSDARINIDVLDLDEGTNINDIFDEGAC